jgi:hypothetical protein
MKPDPKRLVLLISPYTGDIDANIHYARYCMRDSLLRNEAPIASHLLYTQPYILDDEIPEERKLGMDAGVAWLRVAECVVAYTDRGISNGMKDEIRAAREADVDVEYRKLEKTEL